LSATSTEAVILRLVDQGERNRIVTLFTNTVGRTAVMARGARGSTKRFRGHLDLFHRGTAELKSGRRATSFPTLTSFLVKAPHEGLRTDITRFAIASFCVEIVLNATAVGDANQIQFDTLAGTLESLADGAESDRRDLILAFQLRWFDAMGELPPLDEDALRQARLPRLDEQPMAIARALHSGVEIPELDEPRFRAVGVLTRAIRNRVLRRPLESTRFLYEVLS